MNNDKFKINEDAADEDGSTKKEVTDSQKSAVSSESTAPKTSKFTEQRNDGLERDIAAKQQGRSTAKAAKPGAFSASNASLGSNSAEIVARQRDNMSFNTSVSSIDQDVAAKQRGRPTTATPAKPGAYSATNIVNSSSDGSNLRGIEADIVAKQRGNSSFNTSVSSIDQDVAAKQRGRPTTATPAKPGAYSATNIVNSGSDGSNLRGIEADIIAKQRGNSSFSTSMSSSDHDVAAKQHGRPTSSLPAKPGAYVATHNLSSNNDVSNLRGIEADIIAKQRGNSSFSTSMSSSDHDVAAKQHGRPTSSLPAKPGAYVATHNLSSNNDGSNLRGIEADIIAKQRGNSSFSTSMSSSDHDVAAKQHGRPTSSLPAKPGAYVATHNLSSNNDGSNLRGIEADIIAKQRGNSSFSTSISSIDHDVAAKQQGRPTAATPAKPGAYVATHIVSSNNDSSELCGFEADIIAKQRGNSSFNTSISSIDHDVAAKQQGRPTAATPAKPGANVATHIVSSNNDSSELRGFEADIIAKQRGNSSFSTSISSIDHDVAAKQQGRPTAATPAKPGAYVATHIGSSNNDGSELRGFEADIIAKQLGNSSLSTSISSIDHDVAAKQQGRPTAATPAKPGAYVAAKSSDSSVIRCFEEDIIAKQNVHLNTPGTEPALTTMNFQERAVIETKLISNESNAIEKMASELFELDADIAAKRAALDTMSPSSSPAHSNDDTMKLKQNILDKISEEDISNKGNLLYSPSKKNHGSLQKGACDEDFSVCNSPSKHEPSQSALQDDNLNGLEYGEYGRDDDEGLAVAFAVEEEDTEKYLPSAIEFDPDAKPPMYRNRRFRLYFCLMIAAAVVAAFGAALGIVLTAPESQPPENVPYRATLGIRENLARIVSPEQLDDYSSPYKKALDWITFTDPMALTPESPGFLNRFVLAYFYYATSQKKPWTTNCAPAESESEQANCIFVFPTNIDLDLYDSDASFKWLSEKDECEWAGVSCDRFNQIIFIKSTGLSGTFPEGLRLLPYLHQIYFNKGELEGPLPIYLSSWKNLIDIDLQRNLFTGTIPESWFESRSWTLLIASGNQLTGTISGNITKLEDVYDLDIGANKLTGTIPSEIGTMVNLIHLYFHTNQLKGSIPKSIGNLFHTLNVRFYSNSLTGKIPDTLDGCKNMYDLYLGSNLLTGTIPETFYDMPELRFFQVSGNMLTGTISNKLSKMTVMNDFLIANNQFIGTIPSRLGSTDIDQLVAFGNNFNGTVAQGLCDLVNSGQIKILEVDCSAPLGEVPEIVCPDDCCTMCCNRYGEDCVEL